MADDSEVQQLYAAFDGSGHSPKNPREAAQAIATMADYGRELASLRENSMRAADVARAVLAAVAPGDVIAHLAKIQFVDNESLQKRVAELEAELVRMARLADSAEDKLATATRERDEWKRSHESLGLAAQASERRADSLTRELAEAKSERNKLRVVHVERDHALQELAEAREELRLLRDYYACAESGCPVALEAAREKIPLLETLDRIERDTADMPQWRKDAAARDFPAAPVSYETAPRLTNGVRYRVVFRSGPGALFALGHEFEATGEEWCLNLTGNYCLAKTSLAFYRVVRVEPEKAECPRCKGRRKVPGDCLDSPNYWEDPCPQCAAAPEKAPSLCHDNGGVADECVHCGEPWSVEAAYLPCPKAVENPCMLAAPHDGGGEHSGQVDSGPPRAGDVVECRGRQYPVEEVSLGSALLRGRGQLMWRPYDELKVIRRAGQSEAKATPTDLPWRVGARVGRNIYDSSGRDIGRMDSAELAARVVEAVNGAATVADLVRRVDRLETHCMQWRSSESDEIRAERTGRREP